jgi:hypothetical protein
MLVACRLAGLSALGQESGSGQAETGFQTRTAARWRPFWLSTAGKPRSLGLSSIPSLGDGVMLGTAWIDRPVDTQGRAPCFHVLLSARMEARPCSSQ